MSSANIWEPDVASDVILLDTYQDCREYGFQAPDATTLVFVRSKIMLGDRRGAWFQLIDSKIVNGYVDDNEDILVPANTDGRFAWVKVSSVATVIEGPIGPQGDSLQTYLDISEGVVFRNNTGANKVIIADQYLNGELIEDTSRLLYRWEVDNVLAYVDAGGNLVGTTPSVGLFPADGDASGGLNTGLLIVDPADVPDGRNLKITCTVSNI